MDILPAALSAKMAINQQNVAMSMLKKTAEMQQQAAQILLEGATNSTRGNNVNITV